MMDLHCHSTYSDGSNEPSELLTMGINKGLSLMSLSDHDSINGLDEFLEFASGKNICAISGMEAGVECECADASIDIHVLGFAFDHKQSDIIDLLDRQVVRRKNRNAKIFDKLNKLGKPINIEEPESGKIISLTHMADAIVKNGYARDMNDAFASYLSAGGAARVEVKKIGAREYIDAIHECGGVCVLAHPMQIVGGYHEVFEELKSYGLDGVEVYYPTHTLGEVNELRQLAVYNNMMITSGSDFHGSFRKQIAIGEVSKLAAGDSLIAESRDFFMSKFKNLT